MAAPVRVAPAQKRTARSSGSRLGARRPAREKRHHMKNAGTKDVVAGLLGVVALVAGIVQCFYLPFAFGSLTLVALIIAILISPKYRGLYEVTVAVGSVGFVVGVSVAVIMDNPLY
jgi:hypothetical protein